VGLLHKQCCRTAPRFVPKRKLNPIPEPKLVIDHPQVILNDMLGGSDRFRDLFVLQALGNELDDPVFTFTWDTVPVAST